MKNYDLNKGLMNRGDIAQSIHSQNQADVLNRNYKKEYENEKTNYEFQKTLAEVPGEYHYGFKRAVWSLVAERSWRTMVDRTYVTSKADLFNRI